MSEATVPAAPPPEEKPQPIQPQVWQNKRSGDLAIVVPQFLPAGDWTDLKMEVDKEQIPFVWGSFYQVGWLLENGHGVYFGFPMSVAEQFENLGDL